MIAHGLGASALPLALLLLCAHALGWVFERLRQPPLIGEILAGVLLGPFVLGAVAVSPALDFVSWFGLLLLMFVAGSESRMTLEPEDRRAAGWLLGVGMPLPFLLALLLGFCGLLPLERLSGPAGTPLSVLLILAIATAVTSIPVISRIFHGLGILRSRFAGLVIGTAVVEDIVLWAVLAAATAASASGIAAQAAASAAYCAVGLFAAPSALKAAGRAPWNIVARRSATGYVLLVLLGYAAAASALGVNLVFAAFLAGFGVVGGLGGTERPRLATALDSLSKVSFGIFIPAYFAMVGHKLVFGEGFSPLLLAGFLLCSSLARLSSVWLASRLAGFRGLDALNLAVAFNARGGPGIVLATVAYEQGIINASFYTALVLTALLTSQAAGVWLDRVLRCGRPLLAEERAPAPTREGAAA